MNDVLRILATEYNAGAIHPEEIVFEWAILDAIENDVSVETIKQNVVEINRIRQRHGCRPIHFNLLNNV
jgi:hypothetical protein